MIKNLFCILVIFLLCLACVNNRRQTEQKYDERNTVEQAKKDNVDVAIKDETPKLEEKETSPISTSSSCRSYKSEKPDNMRGFDPASEDDMDDNGMSRYMENNDEEGWD